MRSGLTLVEMLVALAIMMALASVAVVATTDIMDQSRFETTQRSLGEVEHAVLGPSGEHQPDGTLRVSGFVADIGRLPMVRGVVGEVQLRELWMSADPSFTLPAFGIGTPLGDSEVRVPAGWRGPYLRFPPGTAKLVDGWNNSYLSLRADETPAPDGEEVKIVRTLGRDIQVGGTGPDEDLSEIIERTAAPAVGPRHLGAVPVRVTLMSGGGANLVIRVYGPKNGVAGTIAQKVFAPASGTLSYTFSGLEAITVGPRVLRAYQTDDDPTSAPEASITATHRSKPLTIMVVQGGLSEIPLVLE